MTGSLFSLVLDPNSKLLDCDLTSRELKSKSNMSKKFLFLNSVKDEPNSILLSKLRISKVDN
jgi:hypothetical protein